MSFCRQVPPNCSRSKDHVAQENRERNRLQRIKQVRAIDKALAVRRRQAFKAAADASLAKHNEKAHQTELQGSEQKFGEAHKILAINLQEIGMAHAAATRFNEEAFQKKALNQMLEMHTANTVTLRAALASCKLHEDRVSTPHAVDAMQRRRRDEAKKLVVNPKGRESGKVCAQNGYPLQRKDMLRNVK